jgi:hypothetical protein
MSTVPGFVYSLISDCELHFVEHNMLSHLQSKLLSNWWSLVIWHLNLSLQLVCLNDISWDTFQLEGNRPVCPPICSFPMQSL